MSNCIVKIKEAAKTFSKQDAKIANFLLENTKAAISLTIVELADKTETSTATITRFCNKLGYLGFKDFKLDFYHDYLDNHQENINVFDFDIESNHKMSLHETIVTACKINAESILNTLDIIDEKAIDKAVNAIDKASKVAIYALSGSKVVAHDVVFKFLRLGIDAQCYETVHDQILSESLLNSDNVAIFISYSGETKDIVAAASVVQKTGATMISITSYGDNSVSKLCDISIQHASIGNEKNSYSTRSRVVQENCVDILFLALCQKRRNYLKRYYELVGNRKKISRL